MARRKPASPEGIEGAWDDPGVDGGSPLPEHPLFPLEEGQKPFAVNYISISRKEDGVMKWIPHVFPAEEMTSEQFILERFGGGTYELHARAQSKHVVGQPGNITKRRLISLPGRPKPIDPTNATVAEERAAGLIPPVASAAPGIMGDSNVLVAILNMNQQAAQMAAQQSQQFMTLMLTMMSEGKKEAAASQANMMQMFSQMSQASQQSMMQLLPLLIQRQGGGPEELAKYVDMMKSLGLTKVAGEVLNPDGQPANESVGAMLENVADIVAGAPQAIAALKQLTGPAQVPHGTTPIEQRSIAAANVPGSAASILLAGGGRRG